MRFKKYHKIAEITTCTVSIYLQTFQINFIICQHSIMKSYHIFQTVRILSWVLVITFWNVHGLILGMTFPDLGQVTQHGEAGHTVSSFNPYLEFCMMRMINIKRVFTNQITLEYFSKAIQTGFMFSGHYYRYS